MARNSSQDENYKTGQLSLYPASLDTKEQLYEATNNAETKLKQGLTYSGKYVVVEDNSNFPDSGIIRVGPPAGQDGAAEMIYYASKSSGVFKNLIRGFAGSRQNPWPSGSFVANACFAEHHNAVKDAVLNIENNLGTKELPEEDSLNWILKQQENRFLSPRPLFRAYPIKGAPSLKVRFQNFSTGPLVRYLWDFGDGTTSVEKSPIHIYTQEGIYTVKLNVITALGAHGITTKSNYITVDQEEKQPFFYVSPYQGVSKQTAEENPSLYPDGPTTFNFVDQTDGDVIQRYWMFDGAGTNDTEQIITQSIPVLNPNTHTISYVYDVPGEYQPSLLVLFESQKLQRAFLNTKISVI
jgi:PKD repeat protein